MSAAIINKIVEQLEALPDDLQQRVLEYTQTLAAPKPHGVPGNQLLRFAGLIPPDDLDLMRQAIELGCERVDSREW